MKKAAYASIILLLLMFAAGLLWPSSGTFSPLEMNLDQSLCPPSAGHIFGTDWQGRDILFRVISGAKVTLLIGAGALIISLAAGFAAAAAAALYPGSIEKAILAIMDVCLAFPELLLAIAIASAIGSGQTALILSISAYGWAGFARLFRSELILIQESCYIQASRALGVSSMRNVFSHFIPNCFHIIAAAGFSRLGAFMIAESSLSFLGLGIMPPNPSWGRMIYENLNTMWDAPWTVVFPGLFLCGSAAGANIIGLWLQSRLNLARKRRPR